MKRFAFLLILLSGCDQLSDWEHANPPGATVTKLGDGWQRVTLGDTVYLRHYWGAGSGPEHRRETILRIK